MIFLGIRSKGDMQKGLKRNSTIRRIHKACKGVEMYVVRIRGKAMKTPVMTQSKPCERCANQLRLLGFRKINYINDERQAEKMDMVSMKEECTTLSWGLRNIRKKTGQVARTYSQTRCLSHTYISSSETESDTESDSDKESVS